MLFCHLETEETWRKRHSLLLVGFVDNKKNTEYYQAYPSWITMTKADI